MKKRALLLMCLFLVMVFSSFAGETRLSGYVHTWFSAAEQDKGEDTVYGFTLRRVRIKPNGSFSEKIKWSLMVGWDKQTPGLFEVYLDYLFSKGFNIKIGQFPVPGAVSGTITSTTSLDLIERPMITEKWGTNNALVTFRSPGVQAYGVFLRNKLYYALMVANPKTLGIFTPGIKSAEYTHTDNGIAIWARLEARPIDGLRIGAFYGNSRETETDIERDSYGAHLFYVKKSLNIKLEYIAGQFGVPGKEVRYRGMYGVLGYKFRKLEPVARYGWYTPNDNLPDEAGVEKYQDITLGINYFHSANIKLQANYVVRNESMSPGVDELKNNLFYICLQFTY